MPLDNALDRESLLFLRMHSFLIPYILDGEETGEEESNMCFSYSTLREISRGMKRFWDSKLGTPCLARIIQDVDLVLKALEIVYRKNGAAVKGLADRNGHRKKVVGKGESVSCGDAQTNGDFALATLTFGPCTSTYETFPFTYHFPSVPISISYPFNCSPIFMVDNFQRFQRQIDILDNPRQTRGSHF